LHRCGCRPTSSRISAACASIGYLTFARRRARRALRFGPIVNRRIDQALGDLAEPIDPLRPADMIEVQRTIVEPIGAAETIARYVGKLAAELCGRMEEKGLGVLRADLVVT